MHMLIKINKSHKLFHPNIYRVSAIKTEKAACYSHLYPSMYRTKLARHDIERAKMEYIYLL